MFNRTYGRFCGHKNTPYKLEMADYPALVVGDGLLYFAHPIFTAYEKNGSYALERYIIKGIREVYDPAIKTEELPSCARVRLRRRLADGALLLHVLYAPPVNRGNVCLLPDFPKLHDVKVTLRVDGVIKSAKLQPSGETIDLAGFARVGDEGVLALLGESTNAEPLAGAFQWFIQPLLRASCRGCGDGGCRCPTSWARSAGRRREPCLRGPR